MRVLSLLSQPNWGGLHAHLAATAAASGESFQLIGCVPPGPGFDAVTDRLEAYGLEVLRSPMSRIRFKNMAENLGYLRNLRGEVCALKNLIETQAIDAVQTAGAHHFHGLLAARAARKPLVWQLHSDLAPTLARRAVIPLIRTYADAIMVNGKTVAAKFPGIEAGGAPLFYFGPVVDQSRFNPNAHAREDLRRTWGIADDVAVVGTVGSRTRQKQHELFVKVAARCHAALAPAVFIVVGKDDGADGYYRQHVMGTDIARELIAAGRLIFVNPDRVIADYLAAFDVFMMTSIAEGMPIALAEAMLMQLPTISSDVGGISEMIDPGVTGFLAAPGVEEPLTTAALKLIDDPLLRRKMGAAGYAKARTTYSAARSADIHQAAYNSAVRRQRVQNLGKVRK